MTEARHDWDYRGLLARYARHRTCKRCDAIGSRIGYGNVPWNTRWENGPRHLGVVPPCPGKPPESPAAEKAVQSPPLKVIDLTRVPADVAWGAEILVPGATVRVYAGMVEGRTSRRVNIVEVEPDRRLDYVTEIREKTRGPEITIRQAGELS